MKGQNFKFNTQLTIKNTKLYNRTIEKTHSRPCLVLLIQRKRRVTIILFLFRRKNKTFLISFCVMAKAAKKLLAARYVCARLKVKTGVRYTIPTSVYYNNIFRPKAFHRNLKTSILTFLNIYFIGLFRLYFPQKHTK